MVGKQCKFTRLESLTWPELAQEITRLGPIELGNISKAIDEHIEKQK